MEIDEIVAKKALAAGHNKAVAAHSAALHAPIMQNSAAQGCNHTTQPSSSGQGPYVTFPDTPRAPQHQQQPQQLLLQHSSTQSSGFGAFISDETNYFHLTQEDLEGLDSDDIEEMDINYQMAMISYRAKKFF